MPKKSWTVHAEERAQQYWRSVAYAKEMLEKALFESRKGSPCVRFEPSKSAPHCTVVFWKQM